MDAFGIGPDLHVFGEEQDGAGVNFGWGGSSPFMIIHRMTGRGEGFPLVSFYSNAEQEASWLEVRH